MRLDHSSRPGHRPQRSGVLIAVLGALCLLAAAAPVRTAAAAQVPAPATSTAGAAKRHVAHSQRQELYFERRYGIGQLRVRSLSAGDALEFRCQVLDAGKASALNDKRSAPVMLERKNGTKLSVAGIDHSGNASQAATPETGGEYWVVFGNRGRIVKPGNMVDLVIGTVHISGLIVE